MKPLFICYSRQDSAAVQEIADLLKTGGLRLWQDITSLGIGPSEDLVREVIRERCSSVVFYATEDSITSGFVTEIELRSAIERHKHDPRFVIVPIFSPAVTKEHADQQLFPFAGGNISRFNGVFVPSVGMLREKARAARKILLRSLLQPCPGQDGHCDIALMTKQRTPGNLDLDLDFDWSNKARSKDFFSQPVWNDEILPALLDAKELLLEAGYDLLRINSLAHITVGIAFGYVFRRTTNFALEVKQYEAWWSSKEPPSQDKWLHWHETSGATGTKNLAVGISISRDVDNGMNLFLAENNLPMRAMLTCSPAHGGNNRTSIPDGRAAITMAREIGDAISVAISKYNVDHIHLFASVPISFAYLIGRELNACGHIHLYEFDQEANRYFHAWELAGSC